MRPHRSATILFTAALFLTAPHAHAQVDRGLLGAWVGTSEDNRGEKVTVGTDFIVIEGERLPLRFPSPGVLVIGARGEAERLTYRLRGAALTTVLEGMSSTWRRVGAPAAGGGTRNEGPARRDPTGRRGGNPGRNPGGSSGGNPLGDTGNPPGNPPGHRSPGSNPLGQTPPPDPFARKFAGDGLELTLQGDAARGYRGALVLRGTTYPVAARASGTALRGSFRVQQTAYEFRAELRGDVLTLASGGKQYRLIAAKSRPATGAGTPHVDRVDHVDQGPMPRPAGAARAPNTKPFAGRTSGVACDLPAGFRVLQESREGVLLSPEFAAGQTRDVVVTLHCLPLESGQRRVAPEQLLAAELASARESLRKESGIRTADPDRPVQRFTTGAGQPAAFVAMNATTARGGRARVWLALRTEAQKALVCNAIYLDGKEDEFQNRVQALFASLRPADCEAVLPAPNRNANSGPSTHQNVNPVRAPGPRRGGSAPAAAPAATPAGNIVMTRHVLRDKASRNMESHTLLAPKGWTVEGGAWWANPRYFNVLPSRDIKITAPDGREVHLQPSVTARDVLPSATYGMRRPPEFSAEGGRPVIYMPVTVEDWKNWIATRAIPQTYRGATNIRIDNAVIVPELTKILDRQLATVRQMYQQSSQDYARAGMRSFLEAKFLAFECRYTHEGRNWEELVLFGTTYQGFESQLSGRQIYWSVNPAVSYRAPEGQLEGSMPLLVAVANSVRVTPNWTQMRARLQAKLSKIALKTARDASRAAARRSRILADANSEISDMIHNGYRNREAIRDRTHRKVINSIRETEDYVIPGGTETVQLPSFYDKVYSNGNGEYLLTNDHLYNPNTDPALNNLEWQAMRARR